jgi:hypothetical protein
MTATQATRPSLRRVAVWSSVALAAVIGLSVAVGFAGEEHGFGWELAAVFGTALGTTLLAVATGLLALLTARDVSAAQELAQLTRDEAQQTAEALRIAGEQSAIARASLDAQTQPFMTLAAVEDTTFHAGVLTRADPERSKEARVRAHVRNAGNATSVVTHVQFAFADKRFSGGAVDPAVPAGETTSVQASIPEDSPEFADAASLFPSATDFSVGVAFADVSGRPRGAVRLDAQKQLGGRWWVRQVCWAETLDDVFASPSLCSQPVD